MSQAQIINYRGRKASRTGSEQRRKAILEASLRIVVKDGVRGVRHRAVAKEAGVPLSATTYYFKDISDLIADTFALFVEKQMSELVDPAFNEATQFLEQNKDKIKEDSSFIDQAIESIAQIIVSFIKAELSVGRDQLLAEQAFRHECLRDDGLKAIAQAYFDYLLNHMIELAKLVDIEQPDLAGEILIGTIYQIEHEGLMVSVGDFDEDKALSLIRCILHGISPSSG